MSLAARHFQRSGPIWVGVVLWLLGCLLSVGALTALVLTFVVSKSYGQYFVLLAALFALLLIIRWMHSRSVSCPLCHGKILHGSKCHKHRDARRRGVLSYTSSLIVDVLFSGRFTCMFCGTPYRLKR